MMYLMVILRHLLKRTFCIDDYLVISYNVIAAATDTLYESKLLSMGIAYKEWRFFLLEVRYLFLRRLLL